jgi:hypothetical protein
MLRAAFWNLLADGLSEGEFITPNGDKDTNWSDRRDSVVEVLSQMMNNSDLIGTVDGGCVQPGSWHN